MRQRLTLILGLVACLSAVAPAAAAATRPNVVLLIFDEFPIDSLRTPEGDIDAAMFPGFAALARSSTWFPNATTMYDSTHHAIPEILDGRLPRKGMRPVARDHPGNVFDVFGHRGWRVRAIEPATFLCRRRWCPKGTPRKARDVLRDLASDRAGQLRRALDAIRPPPRPTFWMRHVLLPHFPWVYLPSGKRYPVPAHEAHNLFTSFRGLYDPFLTAQARQRHLLQLGLVDREVGRLIRRMKRSRMWHDTLLVVTADHGIAFDTGAPDRRIVRARTIDEIAPVPLFVKAPGQRRGKVDLAPARTPDVVPTMADVLGMRLGWWGRVGRSAFSEEVRERTKVHMLDRGIKRYLTIGVDELNQVQAENRRRFAAQFGNGIYGIGPHPELIHRRIGELQAVAAQGRVRASFRAPGRIVRRRTGRGLVPSRVTGTISGGRRGSVRDLALALNGRVAAVATSVRLVGDRRERFSILFSPSRLRPGRNRLSLFEVDSAGGELRLRRLG